MKEYTVNRLAKLAGVTHRTLHYYDQIGLLKLSRYRENGYRSYGEKEFLKPQQILFFGELDFGLEEINSILSRPYFDYVEAHKSHRKLLAKKSRRLKELIGTVDATIEKLKGEREMDIKEYYEGFSDEQIARYRNEVRQRWGEDTLKESDVRLLKMGKKKFKEIQAQGGRIFHGLADNMEKGPESPEVQKLVAEWRQWLENFHHYSEEGILGLGQMYSGHPEFASFFAKYHEDLPEFFTKAVEYY